MAKSSNKSKEATAQEGAATAFDMESSNGLATGGPAKPVGAKKGAAKSALRAKSVGTKRSAAPRKTSAGRKPRAKKVSRPKPAGDAAATDEQIRMRAYLISEWRMQNGIPGDSAHDWLEALRQLQVESGKRG